TGVGYEVRDVDGSGKRSVLVTHDATLGFQFGQTFTFTLLPPNSKPPPPLSIVARAVGTSSTIGETMSLAAQFGPGASAELKIATQRGGGTRVCLSTEQCCGDSCVNVDADAHNCGGCAMACADGETCSGSQCRCAGGSACSAGKACCPTKGCFNLQNDP